MVAVIDDELDKLFPVVLDIELLEEVAAKVDALPDAAAQLHPRYESLALL